MSRTKIKHIRFLYKYDSEGRIRPYSLNTTVAFYSVNE